jgi:hypothetical protein
MMLANIFKEDKEKKAKIIIHRSLIRFKNYKLMAGNLFKKIELIIKI